MLTKWFWDWERTEAVADNEYFMGFFKVLGSIPVVQIYSYVIGSTESQMSGIVVQNFLNAALAEVYNYTCVIQERNVMYPKYELCCMQEYHWIQYCSRLS